MTTTPDKPVTTKMRTAEEWLDELAGKPYIRFEPGMNTFLMTWIRRIQQDAHHRQANTFEPCARADGGINILRKGEPVWESSFSDPDDLINGKYSNEDRWLNALLLCDALALIERAAS